MKTKGPGRSEDCSIKGQKKLERLGERERKRETGEGSSANKHRPKGRSYT